jgi:hypothetical protein
MAMTRQRKQFVLQRLVPSGRLRVVTKPRLCVVPVHRRYGGDSELTKRTTTPPKCLRARLSVKLQAIWPVIDLKRWRYSGIRSLSVKAVHGAI